MTRSVAPASRSTTCRSPRRAPNPAEASWSPRCRLSSEAPVVDLTYVVNFDAPVVVAMGLTGGTTYEATIPGQGPGDLVRYRVDAADGAAAASHPPTDDSITYEGVVVVDPSVVSAVPVLEWFMDDAVYDDLLANHRFDDVEGPAVITYDGQVWDSSVMRINGKRDDAKVSWKVDLPEGYLFDIDGALHEPVDEFHLVADQWPLAGQGWNVVGGAGQPEVDYIFLRQQRNGEFHGVGAYLEATDGRWRNRNDLDDGSYYNVRNSKLEPYSGEADARESGDFEKREGDDDDFTDIFDLTQGIDQGGQAELDFLYDNLNIPAIVNYLAVISLLRDSDAYDEDYRLSRDNSSQRWEALNWDLDYILRPDDPGDPDLVFPVAANLDNRLYQSFFDHPELEELFYRRLKTLRDELLPASLHGYYADTVNSMLAEYALEDALWGSLGYHWGEDRRQRGTDPVPAGHDRREHRPGRPGAHGAAGRPRG